MSIEYFVEGKVVIQSGGEYSANSKGNIVNNAGISVQQNGKGTGVSYNNAQEVNANDKPVNTIDVSLNLFFDGTQNNKTNTEAGKDHKKSNHQDDSYTNDYSNVARGYDAVDPNAENQVSIYIEGIGTEDLKSDDLFPDVVYGDGDKGIVAKVSKACMEGAKKAGFKFKGLKKEINLIVNVFGFSRGAAAARHFIKIASSPAKFREERSGFFALSPYYSPSIKDAIYLGNKNFLAENFGFFGACLSVEMLNIVSVKFKFAGLYDTVASFGADHRGKEIAGVSIIDNDTKQLGLDAIGSGKVYFTLQLSADDEYRDNFDLTNINSAGLYGLEFTLPGVHSDIGGSYVDGSKELSVVHCKAFNVYDESTYKESEAFKKILINEGWYEERELENKTFHQRDVDNDHWYNKIPGLYQGLIGTRILKNSYDKILLNLMFHYSQQENIAGVKYKMAALEDYKIEGNLLSRVYDQLGNYTNACNNLRNQYIDKYLKGEKTLTKEYLQSIKNISYLDFIDEQDLKDLRHQYLHWSVKANQIGLDAKSQNNAPKKEGALEAKDRNRNIQYG